MVRGWGYVTSVRPPGTAVAAVVLALAVAPPPKHVGFEETQSVERGLVLVRLDPKLGAQPGECDELAAGDLAVTVGGIGVPVVAVERVPRPDRHWLLLDTSGSAEGRRAEAMRSAREYIRRVMTPKLDAAAVLTVDDDTILVSGPGTDPLALDDSVAGIGAGLGSALRDGLATVLRQVEGDRHEHLILYWTDGQDTQSVTGNDELFALLARTPNATVFPLALMPTRYPRSGEEAIGSFLFEVAKRSGGEVFASTDPRWLDRVRGWIARRFTVAFTPPEGAAGKTAIAAPGRKCEITILPDPFARPDAIAGEAPAAPRSWVRIHAKQRKGDDPACAADPEAAPWDWPLRSEGNRLAGCVLDAVDAIGPIVRGEGTKQHRDTAGARFAARDVRVVAPPFADLPSDLLDAIPALLPPASAAPGSRSPTIVEGGALLAQRARVAASLFASRPDYRDFALARLARLAEDDLRAIERDVRRAFPGLDDGQVAEIARASRSGRRSIEAARTPTDADLARVLAAWLGDVPAAELFRAWELRLVDAHLAGETDPAARARWTALRAQLGQPEHARVVAPLVLLRDARRDLVGFRRIVLPRPAGYAERAANSDAARARADDRIPDRPFALDVLEAAARRQEVRERLAGATYRATRIDYTPLDPPWKHPLESPFRHARVAVTLEAPARPPFVLTGAVTLSDEGGVTVAWDEGSKR